MLLVFDGGNAPGYSAVCGALTEEGERRGYEVWTATEGFRSLTPQATTELRFERLVVTREERYRLLAQGIPTRAVGRTVLDPGCEFRSERFVGFREEEMRREAVRMFASAHFTHLVCVGGNGTLEGCKAWLKTFDTFVASDGVPPARPTAGFINVSVDNDVGGDRAIGFLTGVEAGATIARGLYDDAYTHKRVYMLEMMGNRSGRHALHCAVAARAHLAVLPFFRFPGEVLREIAEALDATSHGLVVVAQGYEAEARKGMMSASEYFKKQLEDVGLHDRPARRVIAEPFSRYIRGVRPGFADVSSSYLKASLLFDAFGAGQTDIMPFVLAAHDVGVRPFAQLSSEDRVERSFLPLLDRFGLPHFRKWVERHFTDEQVSF